jgi:hypothetical protein
VFGDDRRQAALNLCKSFFPCGFQKSAVALDQRFAQPVRIFMEVLKRHAFGAEITLAEDVGGVSANALYAALSHGDFKAAAGFTKRAYPMVDGFPACFCHRWSLLLLATPVVPRRQANTSKVMTLTAVVNHSERFWPNTPQGVTIANVVYEF